MLSFDMPNPDPNEKFFALGILVHERRSFNSNSLTYSALVSMNLLSLQNFRQFLIYYPSYVYSKFSYEVSNHQDQLHDNIELNLQSMNCQLCLLEQLIPDMRLHLLSATLPHEVCIRKCIFCFAENVLNHSHQIL